MPNSPPSRLRHNDPIAPIPKRFQGRLTQPTIPIATAHIKPNMLNDMSLDKTMGVNIGQDILNKIAAMTGEIISINQPGLAFAQYSIPKNIAPNTSDVAKSGCKNTNAQGTAVIAKTRKTLSSVEAVCLCNNAAKVMIKPTLANSEGWTLKPAILIQRCAPLALVPASITAIKLKLVSP